MTYIQGKNPISRKNSPLNANNPFKRVSPLNEVMLDLSDDAPISPQNAEMLDQMDTTQGGTMSQDTSIEPGDKDYEAEAISRRSSSPLDMDKDDEDKQKQLAEMRAERDKKKAEEAKKAGQGPGAESVSRRSSSPLNAHGEKVKQIEAKIEELRKKYGEADFYEREDVQALFKQKTAAEESHKEEETPKEEE